METTLQKHQERGTISAAERGLLLSRRQALIIELGAIEDYLGLERSVRSKHKRRQRGPTSPGAEDTSREF